MIELSAVVHCRAKVAAGALTMLFWPSQYWLSFLLVSKWRKDYFLVVMGS